MLCICTAMSQFNLNITEEFSQDLARYMKARGIGQKSEAIRTAIKEALEISQSLVHVHGQPH